MNGALTLGPLAVPYSVLLVLAAAAAGLFAGDRVGRRLGIETEPILWRVLLVALVAARLGFVYEFRSAYLASPLSILDIRDGGWSPVTGFIGAWLYALSRAKRSPALKKPLHWAMGTGTALWLAGAAALAIQPGTGQQLPALELATLDGARVRLDELAGKPSVVNLWATWCPPCNREMPLLSQAQADHPAINFVFLNQGESATQVSAWLAQQHLSLHNVVLDDRRAAGAAFGHTAYPTTLFFNARGQLVATRIGELSLATLTEKLQVLSR